MMIALGCVLALGLTPEEIADNRMTMGGWLVMSISIGAVLILLSYCLYMTLSLPPAEEVSDEEHLKATIDPENDR